MLRSGWILALWYLAGMDFADVVGSIGVGVLLVAFSLNLTGRMGRTSRVYQFMNLAGAGLACWASMMIGYIPFVVLEGVWSAAALGALIQSR